MEKSTASARRHSRAIPPEECRNGVRGRGLCHGVDGQQTVGPPDCRRTSSSKLRGFQPSAFIAVFSPHATSGGDTLLRQVLRNKATRGEMNDSRSLNRRFNLFK